MEFSDDQFRDLLNRYINGEATEAERKILDSFFQSYEADLTGPESTARQPEAGLRDEILGKIHMRLGVKRKPGRSRIISLWLPVAAAISLFAIAVIFVGMEGDRAIPQTQQTVFVRDSTGPAQRLVVDLPDGTKVHLNYGTTVSYPDSFGAVREVSINGEGYFDVVSNGKPFIVQSGNVKTQVLGTSFNVKHREGSNTEITLVEGKVNVASVKGYSFGLSPGEQAVLDTQSNSLSKRKVNVLRFTGWKDNVLYLEQTTLENAIKEIEELYAVQIEIANPAIRNCLITAKYQNEPLGNVLGSLQFLLSLKIKRLKDNQFLVEGNGCH